MGYLLLQWSVQHGFYLQRRLVLNYLARQLGLEHDLLKG